MAERINIIGNIGSLKVVEKTDGAGQPFKVANMRVAVKTRKRSRKDGSWGSVDTWYECEASGREAQSWERFGDGDAIYISGIPYYEPYLRRDNTPAVQVYLQQCQDAEWVPGGQKEANRLAKGQAQPDNNPYQGRTEPAQPAIPVGAPVAGSAEDDEF